MDTFVETLRKKRDASMRKIEEIKQRILVLDEELRTAEEECQLWEKALEAELKEAGKKKDSEPPVSGTREKRKTNSSLQDAHRAMKSIQPILKSLQPSLKSMQQSRQAIATMEKILAPIRADFQQLQQIESFVRIAMGGEDIRRVTEGISNLIPKNIPKIPIPDLVESLLASIGPMHSKELRDALSALGKEVKSAESVAASLNRYRPDRFERDSNGKWISVKEQRDPSKGREQEK